MMGIRDRWIDGGIPDDHAILLRWFHKMLIGIDSPSDFELACKVAHEVRGGLEKD